MKSTSHTEILIIAATAVLIVIISSVLVLKKGSDGFMTKQNLNPPKSSQATAADPTSGALPSESELKDTAKQVAVNYLTFFLHCQFEKEQY